MLSPVMIEAIVLAVIQGIAEFLPISSSGHLVILQQPLDRLLGISPSEADHLDLNVAVHVGTLCSILAVYAKDLPMVLRQPRLVLAVCVATVPAAILGLSIYEHFQQIFETPLLAGVGLLITAGLLVMAQKNDRGLEGVSKVSIAAAIVIGLFQAMALMPGVSRSGSTIAAGLLVGLRRDTAALFSFLIAVPAIAGAAVLTVWKHRDTVGQDHSDILLVGAVISFLVGYVALRGLLVILTKGKLYWFAGYCAVVGMATILWQLVWA